MSFGTADQGGLASVPRRDTGLHLLPRLARLFDRALVLDRRDVAGILLQDHRLQDPPHDLAAARLGQHVHEVELAYHRQRSELVAHRRDELPAELFLRPPPLLQYNERADDLPPHGAGTA